MAVEAQPVAEGVEVAAGSQRSRGLRRRPESATVRPAARRKFEFVCQAQSMDKEVAPASRKPVPGNGPPRSRQL